jgi:hypothetical protein
MRNKSFITIAAFLVVAQIGYTQTSEKFLKLTRIIAIDSFRTVSKTGEKNIAFQIAVPSSAYWKVEFIQFSSDQEVGHEFHKYFVKLRNAFLRQLDGEVDFNEFPDWKAFTRKTPIWLSPGQQITFYVEWDTVDFFGTSDKFNLILNAQEFLLE